MTEPLTRIAVTYCLDVHSRDAGERHERLHVLVSAWNRVVIAASMAPPLP